MKSNRRIAVLALGLTCWLPTPARADDESKVEAKKNQQTIVRSPGGKDESTDASPIVMGLDLSKASSVQHAKDLPDLYKPSPDQPGTWKQRDGVYEMPLQQGPAAQSVWLKYPAALGRFYIEYRSDREKPETERTYGPFEGDPFERFKLEDSMLARLQGDEHSADDIYRIQLMLRTGDATLARCAVRLLEATLAGPTPVYRKENYLHSVREILQNYSPLLRKLALERGIAGIHENLVAVEAQLEALTVEIPDQEYIRPGQAATKVSDSIPKEAWGEAKNGLRLASVPNPDSVRLGERIPFDLIVENVSDQDIKFPANDVLQDARADVRRTNGDQVETRRTWYSGWKQAEHYLLRPGERITLAQPSLVVVENKDDGESRPGGTKVVATGDENLRNRVFIIRYEIQLGQGSSWARGEDGVMRRSAPAKGEWTGTLTSGIVAVVASKPE